MIYGEHKLFIKFNVVVETKRLSVYTLNPKRTDRLELIKTLSDKGFNSVKISDYLNERNLKSPKGHPYYPKLIWVTLKKYRKILERNSSYKIIQTNDQFMLQQIKILRSNH